MNNFSFPRLPAISAGVFIVLTRAIISYKHINTVVHFEVQADDVERAKNFYESEIPDFGWFTNVKDTEGNRFGFMQPTG